MKSLQTIQRFKSNSILFQSVKGFFNGIVGCTAASHPGPTPAASTNTSVLASRPTLIWEVFISFVWYLVCALTERWRFLFLHIETDIPCPLSRFVYRFMIKVMSKIYLTIKTWWSEFFLLRRNKTWNRRRLPGVYRSCETKLTGVVNVTFPLLQLKHGFEIYN